MATTTGPTLDPTALGKLSSVFHGELVTAADANYDEHRRVWNGSIDRKPALVARCTGVADVVAAIGFAQQHGLPLTVRGGGHSFPGHSVADGAVVVDLAPMKGISLDRDARTVRAQGGVLLGELDQATQAHGLSVPAGIVTHTGLAGLTLGGGIGWQQRKYGLTIDQLLSVDVVTASGEVVTASETQNEDLFWGIRGGGGNFGVVTEFEFRLNPLGPTVLAGPIVWPMEESGDVLRFYREWIKDAPDELMTIVIHRRAPALPFVPEEFHGRHVVMVACCYAGPVEEGERVIAPMKSFGKPLFDICVPKPFLDHQSMFDPSFIHYRWYYFKACGVQELTDEVIDITVERSLQMESPFTAYPIWHMGGAITHVDEDATAYNGRDIAFTYNINCCTENEDGFEHEREWVRDFWSALEPYHTGVYVNFLGDEGQDRVEESYGAKYTKLRDLKRRYDPDNVFRFNQNIKP
jgi:FAD/FMN-containing dehydrogenase